MRLFCSLMILGLLAAGCRPASAGCPAPLAELVADPSACAVVDVTRGPSSEDAMVTCGGEAVRGPIVDIHFPTDGTFGYGVAPGPGASVRLGVIGSPGGAASCGGCGGVDSHTGLSYGGLVLVPFSAGETLRLVLDASTMGSETWRVAVCPEGMLP